MTVIDDYLAKIKPERRKELQRIREIGKKVVPTAQETISYGMPTLTYKGKPFLGFNTHKEHIGVYPYGGEPIEALKEKLSSYQTSSGAIRVPYDNPIPENLLKELILYKIDMIKRQ